MEIDKITYYDLSILNNESAYSIIHRLDFCHSHGGSEKLQYLLTHPHSNLLKIRQTQQALQQIGTVLGQWPTQISNGTILMLQKFYEYHFDQLPDSHSPLSALSYRLFSHHDYALAKYSTGHFADFLHGMQQLYDLLAPTTTPLLDTHLAVMRRYLQDETVQQLIACRGRKISHAAMLRFAHFLYYHYRRQAFTLMDIFHTLDAYYSMAKAIQHYQLTFPVLLEQEQPTINARQLYHLLLEHPVAYDVHMRQDSNFIFLTGANMAGKSTFIKAVGVAVYLAHVGMGVPAASMELSTFDGLLSNIQVQDNLVKGESFFYNEVQRIKNTVIKITDGRKWLVLIDELFKGTNIQDAMQCSTTVIKGLIKIKNSLFILSTHLYEIGEALKPYPNIAFRYFETSVHDEQMHFSYQLKEGISNDRFGYLILKKEKVVDLLNNIG